MNETLAAAPGPALWPSVWKLLRLRLIIFISGFRRAKTIRKIGMILLGLLFVAFLGFIFFISWLLLRFFNDPEFAEFVGDVTPFLQSVPVLVLGGAFLGILLTSFGVLLQALYLAGDMDFLLAAPIPLRAVFVSKLLQAILPNLSLVAFFALPVLYGLGLAGGYSILYYPLVLIMLAALALAAAGLSSLMVMVVVRLFPARRVAEVIGFVGAISTFLCSQTGQFARFNDVNAEDISQVFTMFSRFNNSLSPLAWPGIGLVAIGEGRWLAGFGFSLLALGVAALVFGLALTTAERLYFSGWASIQGTQRKKKTPRAARHAQEPNRLFNWFDRLVSPPVRAIMVKDFLMLRRDLRNMSTLVTPLILGVVYSVMFLRGGDGGPAGRGDAPQIVTRLLENASVYANVGISLFVGWTLVAHLGGVGFSQEGKSYWVLKSAPISTRKLLLSKFLVAYLPALVLGLLFLTVITLIQQVSLLNFLFALPVVALTLAGNAGLSLAFGVTGANFDWEDPRKMQTGASGCLGALFTFLYLPISLFLFFGPPLGLPLLNVPLVVGQIVGLLLGGIFSVACIFLPILLVKNRVAQLNES